MKKEKVGLIIAVIVMAVVLIFGGLLALQTFKNEQAFVTKQKRIESLQGITAAQVDKVNGLSTLLLVEDFFIPYELVGSEYLVLNQYNRTLGEGTKKFCENLRVELIDLETLTSKEVYHPEKLVGKKLKAGFAFTSPAYVTDETEMLAVSLINLESEEHLVAEFSTDFAEVSFAVEEESETAEVDKTFYPLLDLDFLENQGLDYEFTLVAFEQNKIKIAFNGNHLPVKNKRLYRMFPLLKDYLGDYAQKFELTLKETVSFDELLSLFKEDKEPSFASYEMASYAAIDRQGHQINNLADYQKWASVYEEMDRVTE